MTAPNCAPAIAQIAVSVALGAFLGVLIDKWSGMHAGDCDCSHCRRDRWRLGKSLDDVALETELGELPPDDAGAERACFPRRAS